NPKERTKPMHTSTKLLIDQWRLGELGGTNKIVTKVKPLQGYIVSAPTPLRSDSMKTKLALFLILTSSFILDLQAGSATWNLNPTSDDWNTAANWTPATIPNGATDIATFDLSNTTAVSPRGSTTVLGITFNSGASAYTITTAAAAGSTLTIGDNGVVNNSGIVQNFEGATNANQSVAFI